MTIYVVTVTNDHTAERRTVEIVAGYYRTAQVEACCQAFHEWGWRRTTADVPQVKETVQA